MSDPTTNHPSPDPDAQAAGIASYLFEMGLLKHARRTGWWTVGIKDPESLHTVDGPEGGHPAPHVLVPLDQGTGDEVVVARPDQEQLILRLSRTLR